MIINISNKITFKYKVVLTKLEINNLIPSIKWIKDEMYLFNTANDCLSKNEIKSILKSNPIYDYFNTNDYFEIDIAISRSFSVKEYLEGKTILPKKGVSPVIGEQVVPIDDCPTFLFRKNNYVWKSELGLFEIVSGKNSVGFYNSITRNLVFKSLNQYDKYLEEINFLKSKLENYMEKENIERYARVITVYNKSTKELKYRILNEEFNYNSFAYLNILPLENDELFFKSYLITEKLANEYLDWSYLDIDFDFSKNEYYFETLNAETFSYSLVDLFKDII
jgi:hypothetical protein